MAQEPEPENVNIQMISIVNHLFTPAQISLDRRYQVYRWYSASGKCNNVQKGWVDHLHFPPDDIKTISPGSGWGPVTKEAVSDLWLHLAYLAISELSSELAGLPPCSTRWIWAIKDTTNREGREGRDGQMPAQSLLSAQGSFWAQECIRGSGLTLPTSGGIRLNPHFIDSVSIKFISDKIKKNVVRQTVRCF